MAGAPCIGLNLSFFSPQRIYQSHISIKWPLLLIPLPSAVKIDHPIETGILGKPLSNRELLPDHENNNNTAMHYYWSNSFEM